MSKINIEQIGTYYKIKPDYVGSIAHVFLIKDGRASCYENEYSKTPKSPSLTSAATLEEVNSFISVFETVRDLMLASLMDNKEPENSEDDIPSGTLVQTCDKRYGIVRKVDWHAVKFIKRRDYQIQFPDGVGIFRRDEFTIVKI